MSPATGNLERVAADTAGQPKTVAFATDARLMREAIVMLGRLARKQGFGFASSMCGRSSGRRRPAFAEAKLRLRAGRWRGTMPMPGSSSAAAARSASCAPGWGT
jgi:hypothetical protein